jgi:hypothetical protein
MGMTRDSRWGKEFSSAAWEAYRISVEGCLKESWSDRLGGMTITRSSSPDHGEVTTLVGRLRDQAALSGVLNTLYELHLPILSVELLGNEPKV